jgi:hypothetical protein
VTLGTEWSLSAELKSLEKETNARRRGLLFEGVIADLFRTLRFEVQPNAGTARPRQTDLLAIRGNDRYLIECKWRATTADIDDIDSLRARLRRAFGATELMISMAGFSGTAISDVSAHRDQPILLISGDELRNLGRLRGNGLLDLLWHTREALFTDGGRWSTSRRGADARGNAGRCRTHRCGSWSAATSRLR